MKRPLLALAMVLALAPLLLAAPALADDWDDTAAAIDRGDFATAFSLLEPYARGGNASAQYSLGVMYAEGKGVPQSDAEAVKWYRLAAEQGLADAQYELGSLDLYGVSVPLNKAEAERWMRLAADQGHAGARLKLEGL